MSPTTMPQATTPVAGFEVDTVSSTTDIFLKTVADGPQRPLVATPNGDGWDEIPAQQFLDEVRAAAKGLIATGVPAAVMRAQRREVFPTLRTGKQDGSHRPGLDSVEL